MRGMSRAAAAPKKRLGVVGGFALGCGCKDAKAVAVAAASSSASPFSTEASSTATTATWRRVRAATAAAHPSASGSTGTLTVPSASSSSFPWEDGEADGDGEEVNCKRKSSANTPSSFSGLLRQLNELEQSVVSWGRKSTSKSRFSPPPPPPPPPLPSSRPVVMKQRAAHSGDRRDGNSKDGHCNFSPPHPPPSFQCKMQQHRKAKSMDKGDDRQEGAVLSRQLPPPPSSPPLMPPGTMPPNTKLITDSKGGKKDDVGNKSPLPPQPQQAPTKHRKAKSLDGGGKLDGSVVAVVKQSENPLSDFRRSMANMVVENGIATGDELRELLRHFLALNAPHHHDAILRAFTEIWDEAFSTKAQQHRESASARAPTPPRQRTPPPQRRRQTPRVWR